MLGPVRAANSFVCENISQLESLPEEILIKILGLLNWPDRASIRLLNRHFRRVASDEKVWPAVSSLLACQSPAIFDKGVYLDGALPEKNKQAFFLKANNSFVCLHWSPRVFGGFYHQKYYHRTASGKNSIQLKVIDTHLHYKNFEIDFPDSVFFSSEKALTFRL